MNEPLYKEEVLIEYDDLYLVGQFSYGKLINTMYVNKVEYNEYRNNLNFVNKNNNKNHPK